MAELDQGDGSAAALDWKATVTAAFRATLAATLKAQAQQGQVQQGHQQQQQQGQQAGARGSLDGRPAGASLRASLDGRPHRPRASLDGRPLNAHSSLDGRPLNSRASLDARSLRGAAGHPGSGSGSGDGEWPPLLGQRPPARSAAAERFQQWLRLLLFQLMAALAASGSAAEAPWAAALSCLLHLGTYGGRAVRAYLEELPPAVVAALLQQARTHRWSEQLHAWLVTLAANLLYVHTDGDAAEGAAAMYHAGRAGKFGAGGVESRVSAEGLVQ